MSGAEFGYLRIVAIFDKNETAASFLREDGEGGFASGVSRMVKEIDSLRELNAELVEALEWYSNLYGNESVAAKALAKARSSNKEAGRMSNRNIGHGHVWKRPDGTRSRCGGPGLCSECAADAQRLRDAALFTDLIDIAILIRWKDSFQKAAQRLQKEYETGK